MSTACGAAVQCPEMSDCAEQFRDAFRPSLLGPLRGNDQAFPLSRSRSPIFMAAKDRILSLDLGTQTVSLAEFKTGQNGGLVLTSYRSTELLADPAADATAGTVRDRHRRDGAGARVQRVEGQLRHRLSAVFTRFVKLPVRWRRSSRPDRHLRSATERPLPDQ